MLREIAFFSAVEEIFMQNAAAHSRIIQAEEIISIADACLGGLRGRSALVIGPKEQRHPYIQLLQKAEMKNIYQEDTHFQVSAILPNVQLLISVPAPLPPVPLLKAGTIAEGCVGRRTPLLIFDLATSASSVEEIAGLLPTVCLYTPEDLWRIFS
jgi:hypothetical protein